MAGSGSRYGELHFAVTLKQKFEQHLCFSGSPDGVRSQCPGDTASSTVAGQSFSDKQDSIDASIVLWVVCHLGILAPNHLAAWSH